MKFKPMRDRILVKRCAEEKTTKGGLLIPDSATEKSLMAEIVEVGEGKLFKNGTEQKLPLKKGDIVLIGKYSGTEIKLDEDDYLIVKSNDILGYQSK